MSNLDDKYWIAVADFLKKEFSTFNSVFGPQEFLEFGISLKNLREISMAESPLCVVLHKGDMEYIEYDVLCRIAATMTPIFANEVFVVLRTGSEEHNMIKSIHYKAFLEKLKQLKNKTAKTFMPQNNNNDRMAVYLGNNRALTRTIYGHKMFVNTQDLSLAPHILLDGYWERWITNVFLSLVKPGMSVVDIGANIGYYSLLARHNIGAKGRLVCFEANKELAEIVFNNLMINGFIENSIIENKAVYSENTTLEFSIYEKFLGSSSLWTDEKHVAAYHDTIKKVQVEAVSLDNYFESNTKIDFIKIDAEGAEAYILEGARRVIHENKNITIMMEFAPMLINKCYGSVASFYENIKKMDFEIFKITHNSELIPLAMHEAETISHSDVVLKR